MKEGYRAPEYVFFSGALPPPLIPSDQEIMESGKYFDLELIDLIGYEEFEAWLLKKPGGTAYELIEDYGITNEQLEFKLADHKFETN